MKTVEPISVPRVAPRRTMPVLLLSPVRERVSWRRRLETWGVSVAIHVLMLIVLALIFSANGRRVGETVLESRAIGQLRDDVTSLVPSDHAGDPFTQTRSRDAISIGKDPNSTEVHLGEIEDRPIAADIRIEPPSSLDRMPIRTEINPGFSGVRGILGGGDDSSAGEGRDAAAGKGSGAARSRGRGKSGAIDIGKGRGTGSGGVALSDEIAIAVGPATPFKGRGADMKAKLLRSQGGTVESEKAVELGLDWIARHQRRDGGWGLDTSPECKGGGCPERPAAESDTAATGLALLPFLAAGHTHLVKDRYTATMRKGLSRLIKYQDSTGQLFTGGMSISGMYSHAIATITLCEAYGLTGDPQLKKPAQRGIDFIARSQNLDDGGWRYSPGMPGDTSVFGWQMFALRSGALARLAVPKTTIAGARKYLDFAAADDMGVTYAYRPGRSADPVMTAEALLGRQYFGWSRDNPSLVKGASLVVAHLRESQDRNMYYWYYATQMLHNMGGEDWNQWNTFIRDTLVNTQITGRGCDRGSWDPMFPTPDRWGRRIGRMYVTSLSLLTLEVYYRYLPLYENPGGVADPSAESEPLKPEGAAAGGMNPDDAKGARPRANNDRVLGDRPAGRNRVAVNKFSGTTRDPADQDPADAPPQGGATTTKKAK